MNSLANLFSAVFSALLVISPLGSLSGPTGGSGVLDLVPESPSASASWPLTGLPEEISGYRHLQATIDDQRQPDGGRHLGTDFNIGEGDEDLGAPAYLILDCFAVFTGDGRSRELGRIAIFSCKIPDGSLVYPRYAHLLDWTVVPGEFYSAGTLVGHVGKSGWDSGSPHLHLDVATRLTFEERYTGLLADPWWYPHMAPRWYQAQRYLDPVALLTDYPAFSPEFVADDWLVQGQERPLDSLPVFWTRDAPVLIEQLTRGGNPIGEAVFSVNEQFAPVWTVLSEVPLDILPPIHPEPGLQVPSEFRPMGPVPWVADVPHVTGLQPTLMKVVVGYGDYGQPPSHWNGVLMGKPAAGIVATYAFTDRTRIYPSKIYNILTALAELSRWQEENGPLVPGETYSYLEMTGIVDRNAGEFLTGGFLLAGGVCASVSTLSKTIFLAESLGYTDVVMRFRHEPDIQYAENPLDPAITKLNSDATVGFVLGHPADYFENADYRFRVAESSPPLYLSFGAAVIPDEDPIDPAAPSRHRRQPADARLVFTISLVTTPPDFAAEQAQLLALRNRYADFHNFDDDFVGGFN